MHPRKVFMSDAFFFKFIYYYFKFAGLATINWSKKTDKSNKIRCLLFTTSKFGRLHNMLIAFAIIVTNCMTLKQFVMYDLPEWVDFDKKIDMIRIAVVNLYKFVILSMFVQYSMTITLLRRLLQIVNADFLQVSRDISVVKNTRKISVISCYNQFELEIKMIRFSRLQQFHSSLCEIIEELAEFYSKPVLFGLAYIFLAIIVYSYFMTSTAIKHYEYITIHTIIYCGIELMHITMPVLFLTSSCSAVISENRRTGKIVNKWMSHSDNHVISIKVRVSYERPDFTDRSELEMKIDTVKAVTACFSSFIILLIFSFQQEKCVRTVHKVLSIRQSLISINSAIYVENESIWKIITKLLIFMFVNWILLFITIEIQNDYRFLLYFVTTNLCDMIMTHTVLQFSIALKMIEQLFRVTNTNFDHDSKASFRLNDEICHNVVLKKVQVILNKLSRLQDLHLSLCNVFEDLAGFYAQSMLLCVWYIFVSMILSAFYVTKPIITGNTGLSIVMYLRTVIHFLHHTSSLIMLTKCVTDSIAEREKTGNIISVWLAKIDNQQFEKKKKAIEMADQICQIYGSMIVNNCDTGEKRSILLITVFVFCINFIFWLMMIITSVNVTIATPNNLIFYYLAVYSCHVIMQTLLMQYSIILNMIGYFFLHINKSLIILLKKPNQLFLDAQCCNIDKTRGERLLQMRKTYLILCKISEDISDFYAPLMFFCLSVTFVTLIRSGLYIVVNIADKESNLTIKGIIHCIGYVVHYYFLLVMLTKKASKIVTESKRTGEIVSDCVHCVDNQEIIVMLNRFSNYLLHKKIKFTVFNLFVLDESLLMLHPTSTFQNFSSMLRTYLNQASFPLKMPFNNPLTSGAAVLKCVYYVCKACGLAPIAIRSNDGRKLRFPPFQHSKAGLLYNAVLILVILSMSAAITQCTFVYRTKAEILKFDGVIDMTHNTMASVTAIFVLTVFCIQQRKILELANRMRALGEMSQSLCDVEICGGRKRLLRDVMMICLTTCCTWLSIFFTTQVESYKGLLYFSYIYLCNLIITLTLMQYSIVLRLMHQILRVVNANFHHFSTEPSERKLKVQIIDS
ncbi:hypothetical protein TSAR_000219 [Trichomalopsis sarcophagae]|uniref:Gustatory receptor n=1 Tax=Trichomalopsis sarcophagae TaxID=543379 RepID=A0A232F4W5_9HYME|nr:hypothetical protein TSAR_000219 [Trichomalopsis sarcophagae]